MLNPPVNGKIQGLFNAFECFSSTFQDSPVYSNTFQVCANPGISKNASMRRFIDIPTRDNIHRYKRDNLLLHNYKYLISFLIV